MSARGKLHAHKEKERERGKLKLAKSGLGEGHLANEIELLLEWVIESEREREKRERETWSQPIVLFQFQRMDWKSERERERERETMDFEKCLPVYSVHKECKEFLFASSGYFPVEWFTFFGQSWVVASLPFSPFAKRTKAKSQREVRVGRLSFRSLWSCHLLHCARTKPMSPSVSLSLLRCCIWTFTLELEESTAAAVAARTLGSWSIWRSAKNPLSRGGRGVRGNQMAWRWPLLSRSLLMPFLTHLSNYNGSFTPFVSPASPVLYKSGSFTRFTLAFLSDCINGQFVMRLFARWKQLARRVDLSNNESLSFSLVLPVVHL